MAIELTLRQRRVSILNEKKISLNIEIFNKFIKKLKKIIDEFIEPKINRARPALQKGAS